MSSESVICLSNKLENIDENAPANWLPSSVHPPETPTESLEFLARSWSLSATELSKALTTSHVETSKIFDKASSATSICREANDVLNNMHFKDTQIKSRPSVDSPPISPAGSDETKELFLLHQALQPNFLYNQQLLKTGLAKNVLKGKSMGCWSKEQKERKKHEIRTHNAQLHAAVTVAGVAAAVAALTASHASATENSSANNTTKAPLRMSSAIASAAALVASHCIEIAEEMGADHHQILSVVDSAVSARSNGDIMSLTAGAATALRGASTLKARLQNGNCAAALAIADEEGKELSMGTAMNFVSRGGELLKRTRKGDLHWKLVSFRVNPALQVVVKLKSKHVGGTFTKKKKFVVSGVYPEIPAWPGREKEDYDMQKEYFGIQIADRIIEFECKNKAERQIWTDGIQHMLNCRIANIACH